MQALRQRAACAARRTPTTAARSTRSYASESHGHDAHHAAPQVAEGLGTAFYVFAGAVPVSYFFYSISRPGADGSPSSMTKWLQGFEHFKEDLETRNSMRTQMIEQAAHDKHLFLNARRNPHIELKTPELINSGSPWNVPAGHRGRNLDEVTEHYRKQHVEDEERKVQKLAEKAQKSASS